MTYTVMAVLVSLWLSAPAVSQMISSDPEFRREGTKAYQCTTPKNRKVMCNKWNFANNGWKKKSVSANKSVFSGLANPAGHGVNLFLAQAGPVALFDGMWADQRDLSVTDPWDENAVTEELVMRELKPAQFHQLVEIKEEGQYEFKTCMAARFFDDQMDDLTPASGIQVALEQWHQHTVDEPTVHAVLPNDKAKFNETLPWVEFYEDLPLLPERGDVMGVAWEESVYTWDGVRWFWAGSEWLAFGAEVDGYVGHAGLTTAYHEPAVWGNNPGGVTDAAWTCHSTFVALPVGFYKITGKALPVWRDVFSIVYEDYDGFGAIHHISLNRIGTLVNN